jgi:hypothetical protein
MRSTNFSQYFFAPGMPVVVGEAAVIVRYRLNCIVLVV